MALPFVKVPGTSDRKLRNAVPGLRGREKGGRRIYGAVLGISEEVQERRKKIGRCMGWTSLVLSLLFLIGGVLRVNLPYEVRSQENVTMVFATLGIVSAIGIHFLLFAAEALRGRDAPRALMAVVIFWVTFFFCGIW